MREIKSRHLSHLANAMEGQQIQRLVSEINGVKVHVYGILYPLNVQLVDDSGQPVGNAILFDSRRWFAGMIDELRDAFMAGKLSSPT
jgi:hypothetical protein